MNKSYKIGYSVTRGVMNSGNAVKNTTGNVVRGVRGVVAGFVAGVKDAKQQSGSIIVVEK